MRETFAEALRARREGGDRSAFHGVDPVDAGTMAQPPRPRGEKVITRRIWVHIFLVGAVMAAGTLLVPDGSLPGGFIEGSGDLRHAQTMAFMPSWLADAPQPQSAAPATRGRSIYWAAATRAQPVRRLGSTDMLAG